MSIKYFSRLVHRLKRSDRGVVAIEAALVIPLMIFFMIAMLETYHYFRMISIVDRAAFTVANGLAMQERLLEGEESCASPTNLCTYARLMPTLLAPLPQRHGNPLVMQMLESCDSSVDGDCQTQAPWNGVGWRQAWGKQCSYSGHCQDTASWAGLEATPSPSNTDLMIVVTVEQTYTPFSLSSQVWSALRDTPVTLQSHAFYRPRFDGVASLEGAP